MCYILDLLIESESVIMVVEGSMSKQPLPANCPNRRNTQLVSLTPLRYQIIMEEEWLNFDNDAQQELKDILSSNEILCVASLLSHQRRQIELTVVFKEPRPCGAFLVRFCVTMGDFNRFLNIDSP